MTLENMCDCEASKLQALTPQQLDEILKPYYCITRPELAPKPVATMKKEQSIMSTLSPAKQLAMQELAKSGLDMSFLKFKKKK